MNILIDALTAREGGGVTYVRELVPSLVRAAPEHVFHVLLSPCYQAALVHDLRDVAKPVLVELDSGRMMARLWYQQVGLPRLIRNRGFDLLYTVNEVGAIGPPCPHVVLARNLNVFEAPVGTRSGRSDPNFVYRLTRGPIARRTIQGAARVVFVSSAFRERVMLHLPLDRARTVIIHHGVSEAFRPATGERPDGGAGPDDLAGRDYVLTVSTVAPHKGIDVLIAAFAAARDRAGEGFPDLAVAGALTDRAMHAKLIRQTRALGLEGRVHFLDRVAYERLPALYRRAVTFVFPSNSETFGQPLIEAMASGAPVIASALPACAEVCRDAALYFQPGRIDELSERLSSVLGDAMLRERLRARALARAADFSWSETAQRLVAVLEDAAISRETA
ncbi:MAG: glycosyltransferase family 4 protein [Gemmatimonadota bacterium]|nr:glycosyltransferase family 4 protein [Gemmatimonadota bacterium]